MPVIQNGAKVMSLFVIDAGELVTSVWNHKPPQFQPKQPVYIIDRLQVYEHCKCTLVLMVRVTQCRKNTVLHH